MALYKGMTEVYLPLANLDAIILLAILRLPLSPKKPLAYVDILSIQ